MAKSVLEQLKALDEQRANLIEGAKEEALAAANEAIEDLNALGFSYHLVERRSTSTAAGGRKGTRMLKDAPCPVCEFKTEPLHDGRRHRMQGDDKRPFTDDELKELGYTRVQ